MPPTNQAASIPSVKARLEVVPAPYPTVGPRELIVRPAAVAVNPVDWKIQDMGEALFPWLEYPYVGGCDVAGFVVEVGRDVSSSSSPSFRVGDRVLGLADGMEPRHGAFQHYVAVDAALACVLPPRLSFVDAAVLPLGLATAATSLYQKDMLALDLPPPPPPPSAGDDDDDNNNNGSSGDSSNRHINSSDNDNDDKKRKKKGGKKKKTLVVWGGASSVGANAIQLATASGYDVFATASPRNFDLCQRLGASRVFDYNSPTTTAVVVQELVDALAGRACAGGLAIPRGSEPAVFEVVGRSSSGSGADGCADKFVACASAPPPADVPAGTRGRQPWASTLKANEVGPAVFGRFLPAALAAGTYRCVPAPVVVGHGLESLQAAYDRGLRGLSAQKLVVTLE
ncbi:GroES-like protein [Xylariaceae sp. FL0804]|nr:GroES-like protein [Xylariaceae sp. FL0804]